jgi:hypothetical protein
MKIPWIIQTLANTHNFVSNIFATSILKFKKWYHGSILGVGSLNIYLITDSYEQTHESMREFLFDRFGRASERCRATLQLEAVQDKDVEGTTEAKGSSRVAGDLMSTRNAKHINN